MDNTLYKLPGAPVFSVPAADAERLVALGDGDAALLYIYMVQNGGVLSIPGAAEALHRSEGDIRRAAGALHHAGILSQSEAVTPERREELPEYTAQDILLRSREDPAFQALLAEAQRVLGHSLSTPDMKTLFGIYDQLGLAPDVIMLIFHHCVHKIRQRYGEGRLPTMTVIRKEACYWARREIFTMEQAEEYLDTLRRREEETYRVRETLQVHHRELTPTEQKYLEQWLELGYSAETLAIAYDRTMVSTGKLAWAYMNKIVLDWYNKGLFTPEDIEKRDGRGRKKPAATDPNQRIAGGDDLDRLGQLLNNAKG